MADDLIWSTRLVAAVKAAGFEPAATRTPAGLGDLADPPRWVIVDLTARAYDGVAAIAVAAASGAHVLAVGQHDDVDRRKAALAAGADRVLAYRKLFEDGPATIRRWLGEA